MPKKLAGDGAPAEPMIYGVYQAETGSYTLLDTRFTPRKAIACTEDTKELACEDTSPVKFFDTAEAANIEVAKLKSKFDLKRNPKPAGDD